MDEPANSDGTVLETIRKVIDDATAGRVFGTPITQDGLIVLPVAQVSGGGGGGGGRGPTDDGHQAAGSGGGLGLTAKPLGVFVIKDGKVDWRPAVNVGRAILGCQVVAVVALLTIRALVKARRAQSG